jgi:NAD kinase
MQPRSTLPRVVLITRPSEYALLLARHATHAQAAFFLQTRGQDIAALRDRHEHLEAVRAQVMQAIPSKWRRSILSREDLDRFVFEPADIVVALGQDGLVANTAKYLQGQTVIGINPDPAQYDGVLVRHAPARALELMLGASAERIEVEERAMVEARLDDGQHLLALNELFIGHRSHQSARYRIRFGEREERHSSSGVIVATGTGATGWARSIQRERAAALDLPGATESRLAFFVREAFPSISTGTSLTAGVLEQRAQLAIVSELNEGGLIFGDGLETDYLDFRWGMTASIAVADTKLRLAAAVR